MGRLLFTVTVYPLVQDHSCPNYEGSGVAVARKVPASELKVPTSRSSIWESRHDNSYNSTSTVSEYDHIDGIDNDAVENHEA